MDEVPAAMLVTEDPSWVHIRLEEYKALKQGQRELAALRDAGVDNWEGYDQYLNFLADDDDYEYMKSKGYL